MYKFYNPNPDRSLVGDCVIRGISKITGDDWEKTYMGIILQGFIMHDTAADTPTAINVQNANLVVSRIA